MKCQASGSKQLASSRLPSIPGPTAGPSAGKILAKTSTHPKKKNLATLPELNGPPSDLQRRRSGQPVLSQLLDMLRSAVHMKGGLS